VAKPWKRSYHRTSMALHFVSGRAVVSVVLLGLALAQACGGSSERDPVRGGIGNQPGFTGGFPPPVGGGSGEAGEAGNAAGPGNGGEGGAGASSSGSGGAVNDPGAPVVTITSPPELLDPNDGEVLVAPEIDVVCEVRPSIEPDSAPVDMSSVRVELLDAEGRVVESVSAGATGRTDEYSAHMILSQVEDNGPIEFRCIASDLSSPALTGTGRVRSFVDHGPRITVQQPVPDSIFKLGVTNFEFGVDADPVADDDDGADVEAVTLTVAGVQFEQQELEGDFIVPIDLEDDVLFPTAPSGTIPVTISATNGRTDRVVSYTFVVDGTGPEIAITTPEHGDVIGKTTTIEFTVHDEFSAIDPDSVAVLVNTSTMIYYDANSAVWTRTSMDDTTERYTFDLDRSRIEDSQWQANLTISAADAVGNDSLTRNVLVYLDFVPPLIDLDPFNVREINDNDECSESFDPVGDNALSDGGIVDEEAGRFRVIAWELTNDFGQDVLHLAGLDERSVKLFLDSNLEHDFLVDTNEDGVCDSVGPDVPTGIDMLVVEPQGNPWYRSDPKEEPQPVACTLRNDANGPDTLCPDHASEMRRVISHTALGRPSVIFAPGAIPNTLECTGTELELRAYVDEGWFCAAVVANDLRGNASVSRPLRVCWDDPTTLEDPCRSTDQSPTPSPTCVTGCQPQPRFMVGNNIFRP
jgi:hypothetical protein